MLTAKTLLKHLTFIAIFISVFNGFSQHQENKAFYLVDSLDLSQVSEKTKHDIDSLLNEFHSCQSDTCRLKNLVSLSDLQDIKIWPLYSRYTFDLLEQLKSTTDNHDTIFYRYEASTLNNLGFLYQMQSSNKKALNYFFKSLAIYDKYELKHGLAKVYNNIGAVNHSIGNRSLALKYFSRTNDVLQTMEKRDVQNELFCLNNIAVIQSDMGNLELSLRYHNMSLDLSHEQNNLFGIAMSQNNIGGIYKELERFKLSKIYLDSSLSIFLKLKADDWIANTYDRLSKIALKNDSIQKAYKFAQYALAYADSSQSSEVIMRCSKWMYRLAKKMGLIEEALANYEIYIAINDSLKDLKTQRIAIQLEADFNYEKEIAKNQIKTDLQITNAAQKEENERKIKNYLIVGVSILACFILLLIQKLIVSRRQKRIIEVQNNERKVLLKEIHHRVKNNFQIVSSILKLQAGKENNEKLDIAFNDAIGRIQSMSAIHEMIYQKEQFEKLNPQRYFDSLINLISSAGSNNDIISKIDSNVQELDFQKMITLGIIINELITNSIKHAFNSVDQPAINITFNKEQNGYRLLYQDNGEPYSINQKTDSFGFELINTMVMQIEGSIETCINNHNRTLHTITFNHT